jgi:ATP-dependent DNA ligase
MSANSAVTVLRSPSRAPESVQEWTADQKLRQPVFLGLRDDKDPTEAKMPQKL